MTRENIENNVGYWQEKANLEYISQRQEHGINDPYMIIEIDEAFDAGFDKGYQYAIKKTIEFLKEKEFGDWIEEEASSFIDDFHKVMEK